MDNQRAGISTHAIMDKVREMDLYPVVAAEGRFTSSKRLAKAMEVAYAALSAAEKYATSGVPGEVEAPIGPVAPRPTFPRQ
jgi:hypothetical protein